MPQQSQVSRYNSQESPWSSRPPGYDRTTELFDNNAPASRPDRCHLDRLPVMSRRHLGKCPMTAKVRFRDKREADRAIHSAENARRWCESEGLDCDHRECRSYHCVACKGWHLISWELPATVLLPA